jgi:hypothetical protein
MKAKINILILSFFLSVVFTGCYRSVVEFGNKDVEEETRIIPEFSSIVSEGSFHVYFEYADEEELVVSAESNLLTYIETAVFKEELIISTPTFVNIRPNYTIEVYVKGPYVDNLKLTGSGKIIADPILTDQLGLTVTGSGEIITDFYGDDLFCNITGSGDIDVFAECEYAEALVSGSGTVLLKGYADDVDYKITGSGKIRGYDFPVFNANTLISGSGNIYTNTEEKLSVNITGSGNVYYIGKPSISSTITGTGQLIDRN